ncbi:MULTISPECIES: hypothetical protein [Halolamina]|uniref:DUF8107 domain-containing protein n=1 Tax=Halolamina pelagica TaxID=699431 RepID=A0A1I5N194_9EURY|nr:MULTISPECIES: hypothetical protein [Halolamina]NHX36258.1 hypothetical protein [Halolamina sp. R1-12]SFP15539.1 hypothetical protein SAMN05216277_101506 [Halolamina pelagica]
MSDDDGPTGRDGFETATERSAGNPWVVHGLNLILSTLFAVTIVWGLDFVGSVSFTLVNVATAAVVIFTAAYLMSVR